jgi:hypothetical protein
MAQKLTITTVVAVGVLGIVACVAALTLLTSPEARHAGLRSVLQTAAGADGPGWDYSILKFQEKANICCKQDIHDGTSWHIPDYCDEVHLGGILLHNEWEAVIHAIESHVGKMTVLKLHECRLGDVGTSALAKVLETNEKIVWLDLEGNGITNVGAEALGAAIATNNHLQWLDIAHNDIDDDGAQYLISGMLNNQNSALARLDSEDNSGISAVVHAEIDSACFAAGARQFGYFAPPSAGDMSAQVFCDDPNHSA